MATVEILCSFLDAFLSTFVFAPLVVAYWRGTWLLMDSVFENQPDISAWISLSFGIFLVPSFYLLQSSFKHHIKPDNKLVWLFGYHIYTYVFGYGVVNLWRGVWNLLNVYTGTGITSCVTSFSVGLGCMLLLRCSKNLQAPPAVVGLDVGKDVFTCSTRYNTKPSVSEMFVHDTLFTSLLMGSFIVFYWRGSWEFLNNVLYPDSASHSAWASLAIGYGTFILALLLQLPVSKLSKALDDLFLPKLILEDIYWLIINLAVMCIWRGVWFCCDIYILPADPRTSALLTHSVGLGVLMVFLAGNSVIVRGCQVDGELSQGQGVLFALKYSNYFRKRPRKKRRNINAVAPVSTITEGNVIRTISYTVTNGQALQEEIRGPWTPYRDGRQW